MCLSTPKISVHKVGLKKPKEAVWLQIMSLGGEKGWLGTDNFWKLRGLLDRLLGGEGYSKSRPKGRQIHEGDMVDFWRVTHLDPISCKLTLKAQMKLPGYAYLDWYFEEGPNGEYLVQRSRFYPYSWWGKVYWHALLPAHKWVFGQMAKRLAKS